MTWGIIIMTDFMCGEVHSVQAYVAGRHMEEG